MSNTGLPWGAEVGLTTSSKRMRLNDEQTVSLKDMALANQHMQLYKSPIHVTESKNFMREILKAPEGSVFDFFFLLKGTKGYTICPYLVYAKFKVVQSTYPKAMLRSIQILESEGKLPGNENINAINTIAIDAWDDSARMDLVERTSDGSERISQFLSMFKAPKDINILLQLKQITSKSSDVVDPKKNPIAAMNEEKVAAAMNYRMRLEAAQTDKTVMSFMEESALAQAEKDFSEIQLLSQAQNLFQEFYTLLQYYTY